MASLPSLPSLYGFTDNDVEQAIATAEGYGTAGAIPTVANNPGDLELGDIGYGTINGVTVFPDASSGENALNNQIESILSGTDSLYPQDESLTQAGMTYANDPNWGTNVASSLGVSTDTTLGAIASNGPDEQPQGAITSTNPLIPNESTTSSSPTNWSAIASGIEAGLGIPQGTLGGTSLSTNLIDTIVSSRVIYVFIGIILVAAGLFSFRATQTVIQRAGKYAAHGAELLS